MWSIAVTMIGKGAGLNIKKARGRFRRNCCWAWTRLQAPRLRIHMVCVRSSWGKSQDRVEHLALCHWEHPHELHLCGTTAALLRATKRFRTWWKGSPELSSPLKNTFSKRRTSSQPHHAWSHCSHQADATGAKQTEKVAATAPNSWPHLCTSYSSVHCHTRTVNTLCLNATASHWLCMWTLQNDNEVDCNLNWSSVATYLLDLHWACYLIFVCWRICRFICHLLHCLGHITASKAIQLGLPQQVKAIW